MGEPARRALAAAGYTHLEQMAGVPVTELKKLHGIGPKALRILAGELRNRGLSFSAPDK